MKKIVVGCLFLVAIFLSGCVTDPIYESAKEVYIDGKTIVKATGIKSDTLSNVDAVATSYDHIRTNVRNEIEEVKAKSE